MIRQFLQLARSRDLTIGGEADAEEEVAEEEEEVQAER